MSVGGVEVIILAVVLVMLFGPTLFAFWLGYTMGKKKSSSEETMAEKTDGEQGE